MRHLWAALPWGVAFVGPPPPRRVASSAWLHRLCTAQATQQAAAAAAAAAAQPSPGAPLRIRVLKPAAAAAAAAAGSILPSHTLSLHNATRPNLGGLGRAGHPPQAVQQLCLGCPVLPYDLPGWRDLYNAWVLVCASLRARSRGLPPVSVKS